MLDVDQGDATLVDLPDGSLMLVDAGGFVGSVVDPGKLAVLPALRARRRTRIDVVVLSHPHPDHFGGLLSIARAVPIGEFWDTGQGEAEGAGPAYAKLLEELRARRVPIRRPLDLCGEGRLFGRARLRVLGPCPAFVPHVDANDNSLVLRVELDRRAVLLTGDAEHDQEAELVRREPLALRADLLKVGHHGSRTSSTTAFLAAVRPRVATISSGVRNRFGHPHEEALSRLAGARAHALRLDRVGSVIWLTHGQRVELYTYSEAR
jgi:competence protein ComEC